MGLEHFPSSEQFDYNTGRPAILIGDDPRRLEQAQALITESGLRLAGTTTIGEAPDRLERQVSLGLAWADLGGSWPEDSLVDRLRSLSDSGTSVIVAVAPELIDAADAAFADRAVQILVDPDMIEQASALSLALATRPSEGRVHDAGRDSSARLRQLSDEVGRIAASLARLSTVPDEPARPAVTPRGANDVEPIAGERVRSVIRARRMRARFFDDQLFADPAWDMLLDLLQAEIAQHRVPVSSLCIAAAVPATTALRWIKTMTDAGLFVRRADPHDGRRIFVELSPQASMAMRQYFAEAGEAAGF